MQAPAPLDRAELSRFGAWMAVGALVGALIAIALTYVWTPRWEAIAQVRPGQVANNAMPPTLIEPAARIIERINSRAFADALKERLGLPAGNADPRSRLVDDSLKASLLERAALVVVRVEGLSPDDARRNVDAALKLLADAHAPMYLPTVERLKTQLADIAADVTRIEQERARLIRMMGENRPATRPADQFAESVLMGNLLNIRDSELRGLRDRAAAVEEMLSPERTYLTGPIDRVTVADRPSFPRRSVHAVAGAILGAILGGALGLMIRRPR